MIVGDKFIGMVGDALAGASDFPNIMRREFAADGFEIIEPTGDHFRKFDARYWMIDSFLARKDKTIYVPLISARHPRRGALGNLFYSIRQCGYDIAVIVPLGPLEEILKRWGYTEHREYICGLVLAVWRRELTEGSHER